MGTHVVAIESLPKVAYINNKKNENGIFKEIKNNENGEVELVLGKKLHSPCHAIEERDSDRETIEEKEVYIATILGRYFKKWLERSKHNLGYQLNLDIKYRALNELHQFSLNNFGDPFIEGIYGVHSRDFEISVLDWFANLWEIEKDQYWGYITNGGTEGNLHGLLVGREMFPDGILYTSQESHYSIFKAAHMYRMNCIKIKTLACGEMNCEDLKTKLLQNKDKPAIMNITIGSTIKGAIDDIDLVLQTLEKCGFSQNCFYIHCDAALFGVMLPFASREPKLTFKKPIGSISVSGHKFIGCPMPCGVQILRKDHIRTISRHVEYVGSSDATITGSRSGHAPIFLWYNLILKGHHGLKKQVQECLQLAHYLKSRLRDVSISAMRNELSNIVVFERPKDAEFVRKWQLASQGNVSHVCVMPHVTKELVDIFVDELVEKRMSWFINGNEPFCVACEIGEANCACPQHMR